MNRRAHFPRATNDLTPREHIAHQRGLLGGAQQRTEIAA